MCGRFRLTRSQKQLIEEFDVYGEVEAPPRYNIAPTQLVVTIRQDAREPIRKLSTMRWGLIPSWAKDPSIAYRTINARSETVATTASFRETFQVSAMSNSRRRFLRVEDDRKDQAALLF